MRPDEREAGARAAAFAAFDELYPGVRGNPFIPSWPHPPQLLFLGLHKLSKAPHDDVFEALYGGAAGGGKSQALAYAQFQDAWRFPRFRGLVVRRSYADLALPDAIMSRMVEIAAPRGARWQEQKHLLTLPNRAQIQFRHMETPRAHLDIAGAAFHTQCWDELTHHPKDVQYRFLLSRCRRNADAGEASIPLRMLSGSNPGSPGHEWVRERFVGGYDKAGRWQAPVGYFLPARAQDNPSLDVEAYRKTLLRLPPLLQKQLWEGSWDAKEPGEYFPAAHFGPLLDPVADGWPQRDKTTCRAWDLAASENDEAAFTAGVKVSRHRSGVFAVEDCVSFRATPGPRDARILRQAQLDGFATVVLLEVEPGSGGVAQVAALAARLDAMGYRCEYERPQEHARKAAQKLDVELVQGRASRTIGGKAGRADPVSACLFRGWVLRGECDAQSADDNPDFGREAELPPTHQTDGIRLFSGPWTAPFLSILEPFPDGPTCDEVDALSHAWAWLMVNAVGRREIKAPPKPRPRDPEQDDGAPPAPGYHYRETSSTVRPTRARRHRP